MLKSHFPKVHLSKRKQNPQNTKVTASGFVFLMYCSGLLLLENVDCIFHGVLRTQLKEEKYFVILVKWY